MFGGAYICRPLAEFLALRASPPIRNLCHRIRAAHKYVSSYIFLLFDHALWYSPARNSTKTCGRTKATNDIFQKEEGAFVGESKLWRQENIISLNKQTTAGSLSGRKAQKGLLEFLLLRPTPLPGLKN